MSPLAFSSSLSVVVVVVLIIATDRLLLLKYPTNFPLFPPRARCQVLQKQPSALSPPPPSAAAACAVPF